MQRGICKEVEVVWMQAKKVEKADAISPMANFVFDREQQQRYYFHRSGFQPNHSSQTGSCYVLLYAVLRDNGYLSLQLRLIMPAHDLGWSGHIGCDSCVTHNIGQPLALQHLAVPASDNPCHSTYHTMGPWRVSGMKG
jgi:hypothetical protein